MIVGVPKEIKNNEYRVGLTPKSVDEITSIDQMDVLKQAGFELDNPTYLINDYIISCKHAWVSSFNCNSVE